MRPRRTLPSRRRYELAVAAVVVASAAPAALGAQHLRVTLTNSATTAPLRGAIVSLEREGAAGRIAPTLSDGAGRALLAAPAAGAYRLRVDYVGAATFRSSPVALAAGDTVDYPVAVRLAPTVLQATVVEGGSSCGGRRDVEAVLAVWEEARKGVLASQLATGQGAPALRIRRFERLLDPRGRVETETADSVVATTVRPFRTVRTAAELSDEGYVVHEVSGELFLAPDAEVLLSEEFVADHCLSLTQGRRGDGLVGVAFEPAPDRTVPDIAGTFWLDRATGEPRRLDYEYVRVDPLSRQARAGGTLAFQRLPTGHWIVSSWSVRTPRRGVTRSWMTGGQLVERPTLFGAREEGAELLAVVDRPATTARGPAEVRGTVFDSLAGRPLAGVRLRMLGAGAEAVTDSLGRYAIALRRNGVYTLELSHPRMALFRIPARHDVTTEAGEVRRLDLAIPSQPRLQAQLCPVSPSYDPPRRAASMVGRTVRASDGAPVPYAALRLSWRHQVRLPGREVAFRLETVTREVASDADGYFLVCHLPPDVPLELIAEGPDAERAEHGLRLAPDAVGEVLVKLTLTSPRRRGRGAREAHAHEPPTPWARCS